jgi:hypothetical protein
MPEPEEAERQEEQWQKDDVACGDEEDQQRDREPDCECADHSHADGFVGDGAPSPTRLDGLVACTL